MFVYDRDRTNRIGLPEAIFCLDKSVEQISYIASRLLDETQVRSLFTRLSHDKYEALNATVSAILNYDETSETAILGSSHPARTGTVAIVTAGTSDLSVANEASRTLTFMGGSNTVISDVGVAGLWRLEQRVEEICAHDIVIVVAGMDAALPTVLGGLIPNPIIGVPTSTGYGAARDGETALHCMLTSCAPGITVTNIDNGYGAACAALRMLGRP